ncbi:MAG: HDOD domain-containing protein [Oscillospiraceae bacterium]|nr:HDOD domain-containing protein [Oscillospiraceae bacterium]
MKDNYDKEYGSMANCIARQPIKLANGETYGYELLYRADTTAVAFDESFDGDKASSNTIITSFLELGITNVTDGKKAFVNFTEELLTSGLATLLPKEMLVIEVLETILPTKEVVTACVNLRSLGYKIALDDFILEDEYRGLLNVADIVKVDFMLTSREDIHTFVNSLSDFKALTLLAEKIETKDDFNFALSEGFELFQGYYFSRPVIMANKNTEIEPNKANCLRLMNVTMSEEATFDTLADIIQQDAALTYKLLRVINSAYYGLSHKISNVKQAVGLLGFKELRKWSMLTMMAQAQGNGDPELIKMSLIRAHMMELTAKKLKLNHDDSFMVGMMSLMDAVMGIEMSEVIERANLAEAISIPLLERSGVTGELLEMTIAYTIGDFDKADDIADDYKLTLDDVSDFYLSAIDWESKVSNGAD